MRRGETTQKMDTFQSYLPWQLKDAVIIKQYNQCHKPCQYRVSNTR